MSRLQENLSRLQQISANPKAQLDIYLKSRKKVVGCFPIYTPEVLVDAAGMVPMGMWGAQTEFSRSKAYLPAFACPIMHANMELGLSGTYDGVSAVIIPVMCDTLRNTSQNFKLGVPSIKCLPYTLPQNRKLTASVDYLVTEYNYIKKELEHICGHAISDDAIAQSIDTYNTHSTAIRAFAILANDHLDLITPVVRHAVMKSALFMTKAEHLAILSEVNQQLSDLPSYSFAGKRLVLTGITAEPDQLLQVLIDNNCAVVGDDLAQEMRQYRTNIPPEGTPIERLARRWMLQDDPMAHDDEIRRSQLLVSLAQEVKADGVILCLMKFCDPEEYEYPTFLAALQEVQIPVLAIDVDQQPASYDQARTRIQTFAEML